MILKFAAAALLAVMAFVGLGASAAQATTVTVTYEGTVFSWSGISGNPYGDAVKGSMTFNLVPTDTQPGDANYTKFEGTGSWTFQTGAYDWSGSATGSVASVWNAAAFGSPQQAALYFTLGAPLADSMHLIFRGRDSGTPPLLTLTDLPPDLSAITTLLAGSLFSHYGDVSFGGKSFSFSIDKIEISVTPIPATLPLFISALAGLGWLGHRRRPAQA